MSERAKALWTAQRERMVNAVKTNGLKSGAWSRETELIKETVRLAGAFVDAVESAK